jgi:membrane-associated protease RseP (regulator of RpoE activity)
MTAYHHQNRPVLWPFGVTKGEIMKANVGGIDKIARVIVGLILVSLAALGVVGVWGWIGVVPLLTGLFNFCPLYPLLGISTCKKP